MLFISSGCEKVAYIIWDIETFALNQQSGKGRQVPHLLVAATTCYNFLIGHSKSKFVQRVKGTIKPESVFQIKLGKLTTRM